MNLLTAEALAVVRAESNEELLKIKKFNKYRNKRKLTQYHSRP